MLEEIAQDIGFTVDILSAGNTCCIAKGGRFAVDTRDKQEFEQFVNSPG